MWHALVLSPYFTHIGLCACLAGCGRSVVAFFFTASRALPCAMRSARKMHVRCGRAVRSCERDRARGRSSAQWLTASGIAPSQWDRCNRAGRCTFDHGTVSSPSPCNRPRHISALAGHALDPSSFSPPSSVLGGDICFFLFLSFFLCSR